MILSGGGLALALCAVLLGGTALADSVDDEESGFGLSQRFVERLAGKLGLTSDELTATIKETQVELIDEAAAEGRITEERAEEMKEHITSTEGLMGFGHGRAFMHGRMSVARHISVDTIAVTLDMTVSELRMELAAGATLSEIITARGMTVEQVVDALVAEAEARLDLAVESGRLTQAEADEKLADLPERLTEAIENGLPPLR